MAAPLRAVALASRRAARRNVAGIPYARTSANGAPQFLDRERRTCRANSGGVRAFATASALPIPTPTALPPRTHTCGDLRAADDGASVTLAGWVDECVKKKGVVFAKLRDERGVTQLMWSEKDRGTNGFAEAGRLATESVVVVEGTARARPARTVSLYHTLAQSCVRAAVCPIHTHARSAPPPRQWQGSSKGSWGSKGS